MPLNVAYHSPYQYFRNFKPLSTFLRISPLLDLFKQEGGKMYILGAKFHRGSSKKNELQCTNFYETQQYQAALRRYHLRRIELDLLKMGKTGV
jgi:hypothetical protein